MKKNKNPFLFWFWLTVIILSVVGLVKHFHVKNFQVIKPDVLYTSGQPWGMDYTRLLYKYHIATFINVRTADEHREHNWHNEEITWMRDNGARYIELPIEKYGSSQGIPNEETCRKFLAIMGENTNLPVLVHDSSGTKRVSCLAAVWMLKTGGFTLDQTVEKVRQINGEPLTDKERDFLKSLAE
jgi:protein tyrosine/serine phosphatase